MLQVNSLSPRALLHHFISEDAAQLVLVQKQQPLQTNQLVGLQLEPVKSNHRLGNRRGMTDCRVDHGESICFHSLAVEQVGLFRGARALLYDRRDPFDHFGGDGLALGHEPQDDLALFEDDPAAQHQVL